MKILVTGCDGYVGSRMTDFLDDRGHEVFGFDTGYYRNSWLYNGIKNFPRIKNKDIRNIDSDDLKTFDAVIHLSELSNDPIGQINGDVTRDVNHSGTKHLIDECIKAGVKRFIYSSSCSVYGASDEVVSENTKTSPVSEYAKCKVLNENYILSLPESDFTPVIMRNATVYGPSPRMRFDLAINNLTGVAFTTKVVKLDSDGSAWRPFVHIDDMINAFACAVEAKNEDVYKQIFNVGDNSSNYKIKGLADEIKKIMPECEITLNSENIDKRNYNVNFDKIASKLPGFNIKRAVPEGIMELLELYKKVGLTIEMFESRDFVRLKQIKYLRDTEQIDQKYYWISKKG
jgi:nucleoside-diphosphate-sugar epimerase